MKSVKRHFAGTVILLTLLVPGARAQTSDWLSSLQLVPANAKPAHGNFYFARNYGVAKDTGFLSSFGSPLQVNPLPNLPLYQLPNTDNYIIDDLDAADDNIRVRAFPSLTAKADAENAIMFSPTPTNFHVKASVTPLLMLVTRGRPYFYAVLVDDTNLGAATWKRYVTSNLLVDLGPKPGWHRVWVGLTGQEDDAPRIWQGLLFNYAPWPTALVITNPLPGSTSSVPLVQLLGYSPVPLSSLKYDLVTSAGSVTDQQGFVTTQFFDPSVGDYTTNFFQCYDIVLTKGTNTITLHATDLAGNTTVTNVLLQLAPGTNAPLLTPRFPLNNTVVGATNFTMDGWLDNPSATISAALLEATGNTAVFNGLVERSGRYWIENVPLAPGTNQFAVTATDPWGNTTTSNMTVVGGNVIVTNVVIDPNSLFQPTTTVRVSVPEGTTEVWINGVRAHLVEDTTPEPTNVPTRNPGGGQSPVNPPPPMQPGPGPR